ncbi:MAG: hypothetical protein KDA84_28655, partial [Planctomycetaceae bacterium]|nr:hypothetical protein [Planctomycetaceae bacterium]
MSKHSESSFELYTRVLEHLLTRIQAATVWDAPFTHMSLQDIFPADVYSELLTHLPPAERYRTGPRTSNGRHNVRTFYNLTTDGISGFPICCRTLWRGVSAALTDPELKRCLYAKLAPDLSHRYVIEETKVADLAGYSRPTLYRETEGYEMPAHTDSLKKVVTMHLYLPADLDQVHLGTAIYQRTTGGLSKSRWRESFSIVRQMAFRPNSGYAFVVNNSIARQSWHGCELLPTGAGVRNTLLNTFYSEPRHG